MAKVDKNIHIRRIEDSEAKGVFGYNVNNAWFIDAELVDDHYILRSGYEEWGDDNIGVVCCQEENVLSIVNSRLYQIARKYAEDERKRKEEFDRRCYMPGISKGDPPTVSIVEDF